MSAARADEFLTRREPGRAVPSGHVPPGSRHLGSGSEFFTVVQPSQLQRVGGWQPRFLLGLVRDRVWWLLVRALIAWRWRRWRRSLWPQQTVSQLPGVPEIDGDLVRQPDLLGCGLHRSPRPPMQAGQGGSQAGVCMVLGGHRPQRPCHQRAPDRSALQRQEGQEALRPLREDDGRAFVLQPEPVEQGDPKMRAIPGLGFPSLRFAIFGLVQNRPPRTLLLFRRRALLDLAPDRNRPTERSGGYSRTGAC